MNIYLCIITLFCSILVADDSMINVFPTESQMDNHNFVLVRAKDMTIANGKLYILDQREHAVHIFDLNGNYVKSFGFLGEGPGELSWPNTISVQNNRVLISCKNGISLFDDNGTFLKRRSVMDFFYRIALTKKNFFYVSNQSHNAFGIYSQELERIKSWGDSFQTNFSEKYQFKNNMLYENGKIYVLQQYGVGFRVFDQDGSLSQKGNMDFDPHQDPEYKELNYYYTFKAFAIHKEKWIASVCAKGKIRLHVFDREGHQLQVIKKPIQIPGFEGIIEVAGFRVIDTPHGTRAYVVTSNPESKVFVFDLDLS